MIIRKHFAKLFFLVVLLMVHFLIAATSTGRIKGTVTSAETGEALYGVSIQIDGTALGAKTNIDGEFNIFGVPQGNYQLKATVIGFTTTTIADVVVSKDSTTEINIEMYQNVVENGNCIDVRSELKDLNTTGTVSIRTQKPQSVDELMPRETGQVVTVTGKRKGIKLSDTQRESSSNASHQSGSISTISIPIPTQSKEGESEQGEVRVHKPATETDYFVDGVRRPPQSNLAYNMAGRPRTQNVYRGACAPKPYTDECPPPRYWPYYYDNDQFDAMNFQDYGVNPFIDTEDDHLSTFAADIDDASYIMTRSYLQRGQLPPEESVRIEEFINHFDYNYDAPQWQPFAVHLEGGPSHFGQNSQLLRIGIKAQDVHPQDRLPANLIFLVDNSGSMARENRLELVKNGLRYLVDQLDRNDRVGIVIFNSGARKVINPTPIRHRREINNAISNMHPGGSTNLDRGLRLAYQMAERFFEDGRINRIILCSDGVANVGITNVDDLLHLIKRRVDMGITLTAIGVGMGNHNDALLEQLGDKGDGSYAYIDDIAEARRVFVENLTGMLQMVARDVKIQVDFDPRAVRSYRLLGYENRDVADRDFRNDRVDGGEIGSGHQVTALYEVKLREKRHRGRIGEIYVRYKDPDGREVEEFRVPIKGNLFQKRFRDSSPQLRLAAAAAEFGEILKKTFWAKNSSLTEVYRVVDHVYNDFRTDEVREFLDLIRQTRALKDQLAERDWPRSGR